MFDSYPALLRRLPSTGMKTDSFTRKGLELAAVSELDNDDRLRVLSIIDQFRELGVNEEISLPQLVVVGDQSSGKSSLLEGLTGLSFPVASDLCTRFATQIVLRRAPASEATVLISIIPGPEAQSNKELKDELLNFGRSMDAMEFGSEQFTTILDEAAICMGLPGSKNQSLADLSKRFSDDVLKIELSGPDHPHLSVVDVPGLFHNPTKYQTVEDRAIIRTLIEGYVTDKRTIILAVMDARNNLANQEVFHMAQAADPAGTRTVGVITKCDAIQSGDEDGVLKIARNEMIPLTHGWFAVRNRSTQDINDGVTIAQRHVNEKKFFNTAPWNGLRKDRVGIAPLKALLGQLLFEHIRTEFPGLVREIEALATETQTALDDLGPCRQSSADQRRFLNRIASNYQQDVVNSLKGVYSPKLTSNSPRKLRTRLRALMDTFASRMALEGHARPFRTVDDTVDPEYKRSATAAGVALDHKAGHQGARKTHHLHTRTTSQDDDVFNNNIYDWIRLSYRDSRGVELPGTVNPSLLEVLFRQQSANWRQISTHYLKEVLEAVSAYNEIAFVELVVDPEVRKRLLGTLDAQHRRAEQNAWAELDRLLEDEQGGILLTANHYFADTLNKIREERLIKRLNLMGLVDGSQTRVEFKTMMLNIHLSNEDQAVYDIHDILKAYYKVALKRYTDNVVMQVVERHILGTNGPVRVFCPEFVRELSDGKLAELAQENFATAATRSEIQRRAERLQKALDIARKAGI